MKIVVLQHAVAEGPGDIGLWAARRGHKVEVRLLYAGDSLPGVGDFDLLVVMGGEMNIYQYRDYPWLKLERKLISAAMEAGKKVVGICLGAQLIADALGARVTQNPRHEIGWFPLRFTPEAQAAFPGLPAEARPLHWHGDTFELPPDAVRLAASEACPEQGFLVPGKCLALQFHFEMNPALVRDTVNGSSDYALWPKGPFVQPPVEILGEAEAACVANRPLLYLMLDKFVAG